MRIVLLIVVFMGFLLIKCLDKTVIHIYVGGAYPFEKNSMLKPETVDEAKHLLPRSVKTADFPPLIFPGLLLRPR